MAIIDGNWQSNSLIGTLDADTITARGGDDTVDGGEGDDSILGNNGDDILFGGAGNDTIKGGNNNDWITGGLGNDKVFGNNGEDTLMASEGNDTLNGGSGNDTVVFDGNRADYTVTQINDTVVLITDSAGNTARVVKVESFQFADVTQSFAEVASPIDDLFDDLFTGTVADEIFDGGIGNDTLTGDNLSDFFDGGSGTDTFDFSQNATGVQVVDLGIGDLDNPDPANLKIAAAGADISSSPGGTVNVERMIGTSQDDIFMIVNGDVTYIDAGAGDDVVLGSFSDDTIIGGSGNDQMGGLFGDDLIETGDGFDFVFVDRDLESGVALGHGHDVVTDFDVTMDLIIVEYDAHLEATYDPFADVTQTTEGALLTMATDSSILLAGVDVVDLNAANFMVIEEYVASTGF